MNIRKIKFIDENHTKRSRSTFLRLFEHKLSRKTNKTILLLI